VVILHRPSDQECRCTDLEAQMVPFCARICATMIRMSCRQNLRGQIIAFQSGTEYAKTPGIVDDTKEIKTTLTFAAELMAGSWFFRWVFRVGGVE